MKRYLFLLILFYGASLVTAQANRKIKLYGTVASAETNTPIAYANLYLDENNGTNTLENGMYELIITPTQMLDTLTISAIGFKTLQLTISKLRENLDVKLKEDVFSLDEVVITPLSAFPILSQVSHKSYKNYKTKWVSADVAITQIIFFESEQDASQKSYIASQDIKAKINYKGGQSSAQKWAVTSIKETPNFREFDELSETSTKAAINLYDIFNRYEVFRRISNLKKNHPRSDKNVFDNQIYKSNSLSRVIDFDTIADRKHYVISSELLNVNRKKNLEKSDFKLRNEKFRSIKNDIKTSLKNYPIAKDEDSLDKVVTNLLVNSNTNNYVVNRKNYFWIEQQNYTMSKYVAKVEYSTEKTNTIYNKFYEGVVYDYIEESPYIKAIEVLDRQYKTKEGVFYKYICFEFSNYNLNESFIKIERSKVLSKEANLRSLSSQKALAYLKEKERFDALKLLTFLKNLEIRDHEIEDFYKEY